MKKILSALIVLTMLVPNISFADDRLNYEDAVKISIKNNLQLERTSDIIDELDDALETGVGDLSAMPFRTVEMIVGSSIQFQSMSDNKKLTQMNYDAQKEAIALNIKNLFLKIEYLEKNKLFLKEKMNNLQKNLNLNEKRYKKGYMSKIDYNNAKIEVDKIANAQKENELQINLAYKDLANVMNSKNTNKIQYIDVKYQKMDTIGMSKENAVAKAIGEAPVIFAQNSQIKILEERVKYDLLDKSQTALPKDEFATSVQIQDVNLRITKQNIENAVLETANAIENLELNIKNMQEQLENIETQNKNLKALVRLGKKTAIEAENVEVSINELKLQIENMKNNHHILLERYKKPYLLTLQ